MGAITSQTLKYHKKHHRLRRTTNTSSSSSTKKTSHSFEHPIIYAQLQDQSLPGERILTCSFKQWVDGVGYSSGFADTADYGTERIHKMHESKHVYNPDLTEGRYFEIQQTLLFEVDLFILEPGVDKAHTVTLPEFYDSGKRLWDSLEAYQHIARSYAENDEPYGVHVIGCHGNLAVIQSLDRISRLVPEFYFVDLEIDRCVGKFSFRDGCEMVWYECYISSDHHRVVLRANIVPHVPEDFGKVRTHSLGLTGDHDDDTSDNDNDDEIILTTMTKQSRLHEVFSFCNRYGNQYMFRGRGRNLDLIDLETMGVENSACDLPLPADIVHIRSSNAGHYLAVRCLFKDLRTYCAQYECEVNVIAVLDSTTLGVLFLTDVNGYPNVSTDIINIQVFPRFSSSDSAIAAMVHDADKKQNVRIFKLPFVLMSLQQLCRNCIRKHVFFHNVDKLKMPPRLLKFLKYDTT